MGRRGKDQTKMRLVIIMVVMVIGIAGMVILGTSGNSYSWTEEASYGNADSSFGASIIPYSNGQPLAPIVMGAFTHDTAVIDSFHIVISWESSGSSINWETFQLDGTLSVRTPISNEHYETWSSTSHTDSKTIILVLGTDICLANTMSQGNIWELEFSCTLTASVQDDLGVVHEASKSFSGYADVYWDSTFNFDGNWDTQF